MNVKCQIVVARDEVGRLALLYLGDDAAKASQVMEDKQEIESLPLKGKIVIEHYRKPLHFKRKYFEIEKTQREEKNELRIFPKRK